MITPDLRNNPNDYSQNNFDHFEIFSALCQAATDSPQAQDAKIFEFIIHQYGPALDQLNPAQEYTLLGFCAALLNGDRQTPPIDLVMQLFHLSNDGLLSLMETTIAQLRHGGKGGKGGAIG